MTPIRFLAAAALTALAAACSDIGAPLRDDAYEYQGTIGDETVAFRWPADRLPVRIWAEDSLGMPAKVEAALAAWRPAALYNEWTAALVADSSEADIIVRVSPVPVKTGFRRLALESLRPECEGVTDYGEIGEDLRVALPIRVTVQTRLPGAAGLDACLALTTTHEIGHAFGILRHSPDPEDIMFGDPTAAAPSEADLGTLELVYHRPANLTPTGR